MNFKIIYLQYIILYIYLSVTACSNEKLIATNAQEQKKPCDCAKSYNELVEKLELNYIGLALIRNTKKHQEYETLKKIFASQSNHQTESSCTQFLMKFLSFFEDGHLYVLEYPKHKKESLEKQQFFLSKYKKTGKEINEMLLDTSDVLVGKWSDGESVFAIVKNDTLLDGYLIGSTMKNVEIGNLKLRLSKTSSGYEGTYYPYDFNTKYVRAYLYKENNLLKLIMGGSKRWVRSKDEKIISYIKEPKITKINNTHTVLTIPSFSVNFKDFQKFLKKNKKIINKTEHLIIDIRGNTGGNTIYFPLIKFFGTNTLTSKPGYVLASSDNKAYFKKFIGFFGWSKVYSPLLKRMIKNGEIVDGPKYTDRKFKEIKNNIERVSILTDNGCMSASESFILHAKGASKKVMTFGTPTGGMIDYTSTNSIPLKHSGSQNILFRYPTGTLHKDVLENGFNKKGIIPDIYTPSSTSNLIQFVINHYNNINP